MTEHVLAAVAQSLVEVETVTGLPLGSRSCTAAMKPDAPLLMDELVATEAAEPENETLVVPIKRDPPFAALNVRSAISSLVFLPRLFVEPTGVYENTSALRKIVCVVAPEIVPLAAAAGNTTPAVLPDVQPRDKTQLLHCTYPRSSWRSRTYAS